MKRWWKLLSELWDREQTLRQIEHLRNMAREAETEARLQYEAARYYRLRAAQIENEIKD